MNCPLCKKVLEGDLIKQCLTINTGGIYTRHYTLFDDKSELAYVGNATFIYNHQAKTVSIERVSSFLSLNDCCSDDFYTLIKKYDKLAAFV